MHEFCSQKCVFQALRTGQSQHNDNDSTNASQCHALHVLMSAFNFGPQNGQFRCTVGAGGGCIPTPWIRHWLFVTMENSRPKYKKNLIGFFFWGGDIPPYRCLE